MKTDILGVPVNTYTFDEALNMLLLFLEEPKNHMCITPNPEMIMAAQTDHQLMSVLKSADLVVPDGIGVVIASRFQNKKIKERVAGCDLTQALFANAANKPLTAYFLGGKPGVCEQAKINVSAQYKGVSVVGCHDGYFDVREEMEIIRDIQALKPDVLFVGLGFPKQEKWMAAHREELPVRLSMGVGGTIDVLAGVVRRAPVAFRKTGLEWFYRLIKQPGRFIRMLQLPLFMLHVIVQAIRNPEKRNE